MLVLLQNADLYAPWKCGHSSVLVGGGKVLAVAPHGEAIDVVGVPYETVDLEGRRLLPGFVDCHAHITGGGGEDGASTKVPAPLLTQFTRAGVTSVVGLLGTDDVTRATAELLAGARSLRESGLSAWCWTGGYHLPPTTLTGTLRSDIVHLDSVIGAGEIALSDHRSSQPTLEDLLKAAGDCHVGGLIARKAGVLHLHLGDGPRGLALVRTALDTSEIPARVFHPTHINRRTALFDEALQLAEQGCHVDLTAFPVAENENGISAEQGLQRYLDSGLPTERISVSSDGGGCLPVFNSEGRMTDMEIGTSASLPETLAKSFALGIPLEVALPAFTSNIADHLRLTGKGKIKTGADADMIVLGASFEVESVMANGRWMVKDSTSLEVGVFE
ncbi:MAG: beta-aspartyl-peptidase [Planctomycetota bacterium]|jgi:beta-aspartyl-dipeptidase (metallo-type)|nr:beta-aspartyl-peptidase [Planctomycetota bacterium]MDP6940768.1 beta-aspartyl-peptidase [Planctomycetota bacterium]